MQPSCTGSESDAEPDCTPTGLGGTEVDFTLLVKAHGTEQLLVSELAVSLIGLIEVEPTVSGVVSSAVSSYEDL